MPLLERDDQLAALDEYAEQARRGSGRLVLVSGEAGVGKTALLEEFERTLPSADWFWGACDGLFTPRPLGPVLDIAERVGGELRRLCREEARRDELLTELLRLADDDRVTVLGVEDVHWADKATLDLLRLLGRRIRDTPMLVLVSYRDDALAPTDPLRVALGELSSQRTTRHVTLPGLTPDAVRRLAEGSRIEPVELHRLTAGNPFFVTEVLRGGSAAIPASARDAVLARVAGLGDGARRVLELAALDGKRVDARLLEIAADADPELLDELVSAGLLCGDGSELRFRHEIARIAVDSTVAPHRRTSGHRAILDALLPLGDADDARLAYHAEGAGAAELVARFAPRAGRHAAAMGAHREAAAQFERALRFPDPSDPAGLAELYRSLAEELTWVDRWPESAQALQAALELWHQIGDRRREGEGLRRLSTVMWRLCRGEEGRAALTRAIELLEPLGDNVELARAYAAHAFTVGVEDATAGRAMLDTAVQMAERLGDRRLQSDVLNNCAFAEYLAGREWAPTMDEALRVGLDADAPQQVGRAYANAYTFHVSRFEFARAERHWLDGIKYCDERNITTYSTCLRGHRAVALLDLGHWDEAEALARRVLGTGASPVNLLTSQVTLGRLLARRGEPDEEGLLDSAIAAADDLGETEWVVLTRTARAEARWLAGDLEGARRDLEPARRSITGREPDEDAALGAWEQRLLGGHRALAPHDGPFHDLLSGAPAAAARRWERLGCGYHAALAWFDSGTEDGLRRALGWFDDLGAGSAAVLTRRRMRELGVRSIPSGARSSTRQHPRGLTRRESEVLALVCEGLTNDDIAAALFISPKTVDHHVSAVLTKLGVPTRRRAAAEARRMGLVEPTPTT